MAAGLLCLDLAECLNEFNDKMKQDILKSQSEGGSFLCIVCQSRKSYDVHLLEGKKCTDEEFVTKFIKLVTKDVFRTLCENFKSHNEKNYVCRSCFSIVLKTHDNIIRLQTGVKKSIKKQLRAKNPSLFKDEDDGTLDEPMEIRRYRRPGKQALKKEELGKHRISSLKVVRINDKYPGIILKRTDPNSSNELRKDNRECHEASLEFVASKNSSLPCQGNNAVDSEDISLSSENTTSTWGSSRNFGFESLINAARVVAADQNIFNETSNDFALPTASSETGKNSQTNGKSGVDHLRKAGPLSWKVLTNRPVLPYENEELNPAKIKNLIIKTPMPVDLARLRNNTVYMCTEPNCGWIFVSEFSLNNHVKHLHYSGRPHKCPYEGCDKAYAQNSKLKEHIKSHTGDKPFVCSVCGKGFAQSVNLKHHMVTHSDEADEKKYKCPRPGCKQAYKYPHTLKRHLDFHDGGELPFPCPHPGCGKAYKNNYELKCHYRHHTGEKPYKCTEPGCGKSFRLPGQYTIHRRNHRGERPFRCTWANCDAAYSSRGPLENHVLSHKGRTFCCDTCGKTFTYKVAMLVHRKKTHTDERDFRCEVDGCGKAFHFRFALNAHITKVHSVKNTERKRRVPRGSKKLFLFYNCPVLGCGKQYVAKANIDKHVDLVHHMKDVKVEPQARTDLLTCSVEGCESQFLTERALRYHRISAHNPYASRFKKIHGGKRFSCTYENCSRIYETLNALREHVARVHASVPREKMCFQCGAAFRHIQQLEIHIEVMHGEESLLNEHKNGIFICKAEKCGLQFSKEEELKQHVHKHIENPPFKCEFDGCRRAFLTEKNFASHILIHNNKKPFKCNFEGCSESFGTQFKLLKHSIKHFGKYRCPIDGCSKKLLSLNSARVHMFRHTGEKPYVCGICGMAFAVSSNWLRHRRTHTGERPFECTVCFKRFADKAILKTHVRKHTGEKPYSCEVCSQRFPSMSSHKIHKRLHTGESPYVCTVLGCNKRFRNISGLKSHKNVHNKASHLCSQCGKVYKWGIKKHKCKATTENASVSSDAQKGKQLLTQLPHQPTPHQQSQQQLHISVQQSDRLPIIHAASVLHPHQHHQQQQQQSPHQAAQQSVILPAPALHQQQQQQQFQVHHPQSLSLTPLIQLPQQPNSQTLPQAQLHPTQLIQHHPSVIQQQPLALLPGQNLTPNQTPQSQHVPPLVVTSQQLQDHPHTLAQLSSEFPYKCPVAGCDKSFRDINGLKSHKNDHSKASQLCGRCGKVYKWGVKKHKCKAPPDNAAVLSEVQEKQSPVVNQLHHQHQQQQQQQLQQPHQPQIQHPPQQHQISSQPLEEIPLSHTAVLISLQNRHQQQLQQQQQQRQQQQSPQHPQQQPITHASTHHQQQNHLQEHLQLQHSQGVTPIIQMPQQPNSQNLPQPQVHPPQIVQHHPAGLQQQPLTLLPGQQQSQNLNLQQHYMSPQVLPSHHLPQHQQPTQPSYVMSSMVMMPEQLSTLPGPSVVREVEEGPRLVKNDNPTEEPTVMQDMDRNVVINSPYYNYMILYERPVHQ